ncbi:CocE/NonD family hydrolase [Novosphingobium flavum]|uniref:CocE/NonD family hydrolase n=1 Tax=Novosphingobium aerophilum TaxID=2839843 RepID=UPI001639F9CA|nr:CocE/NonD family hydrolase [Novosphingobium aerophilum]MBC2662786.1 CocE/NonD family hydrolase [Novosphingobium aerophilum]
MIRCRSDIVEIVMSDGVTLAARLYRPEGDGPWPTLFAASAYRFDNDDIPETFTFLWRETGPIDWYIEQGYSYLHVDVRGSGRSGGDYGFFDARERRDLYEVIEWIAEQSWSTGKVGGIGHSYYAASQWCMASERPPHLACIAPYDGHCDIYRGWAYNGGIASKFLTEWWCGNVRPININPLTPGAPPRDMVRDLPHEISVHPIFDDFWRDRSFAAALDGCTIPLFSIGVWSKLDLHLTGNIEGYQRFAGPKKLMITGAPHMSAAQGDFESPEFHEKYLLPFYDHYLKGEDTGFDGRPPVTLHMRNAGIDIEAEQWPPSSGDLALHLSSEASGGAGSLNDGSLVPDAPAAEGKTSYSYPDRLWSLGNVQFTATGIDPISRNLTFSTAPLEDDLWMAGCAELTLFLSSSRRDADVILKLVEQIPGRDGAPPRSVVVTKGWLRASHRSILDRDYGLRHRYDDPQPIEPGQVYELNIGLVPMAYKFTAGSRIRLDMSCTDSPVTDAIFSHVYTPDMVGEDTIHHGPAHLSRLTIPLLDR